MILKVVSFLVKILELLKTIVSNSRKKSLILSLTQAITFSKEPL